MRAITFEAFGGPDLLEISDVPKPVPQAGEVLVRVAAAAVNPLDIQTRRGDYADAVRLPGRLGLDVAGTVEAVGPNVPELKAGDEVYYFARPLANEGAYADYHLEFASLVARKPSTLTFVEAASIPCSAATAWACLFELAAVKPSERVMILGGSGGFGIMAVQLAHLGGAYVVATCREDQDTFLRSLGADATIDYRNDPKLDGGRRLCPGGFDVVLDGVGGQSIERAIEVLAPGGRLVSIVDQSIPQNLLAGWRANATIHLMFAHPDESRLNKITSLIERGLLRPVVERTFKLEDAAEAHTLVEQGGRRGKIVIELA